MNWQTQTSNQGSSIKLLVYLASGQQPDKQYFHAFAGEEKKGTAIAGLTRRILQGKLQGKYSRAVFYKDGVEVERWECGIRISKN